MIICFKLTLKEFLSGKKTVTRKDWLSRNTDRWQRWFDLRKVEHDAYDTIPGRGGKKIGRIRLTERPYLEYLRDMPEEDLIHEGGMCDTLEKFYSFVGCDPDRLMTVIRFEVIEVFK